MFSGRHWGAVTGGGVVTVWPRQRVQRGYFIKGLTLPISTGEAATMTAGCWTPFISTKVEQRSAFPPFGTVWARFCRSLRQAHEGSADRSLVARWVGGVATGRWLGGLRRL